jgi:hypothetical protein
LLIIPVASRQLIFFNDDEGAVTVPTPILSGQRTLAQIAIKASQKGRIKWSDSAFEYARDLYISRIMVHPSPLLARQWTNFCRLTLIYALLDETDRIEVEHVEAAASIIRYSRFGVEQIFKRAPRPRLVEDILRYVRGRGNRGITLTDLTREFSNHLEIGKRNAILAELLDDGLIVRKTVPTTGRPAEWLVATEFSAPRSAAVRAKQAKEVSSQG